MVCIGRNFADHISELQNEIPDSMVVFAKPNSAIATELESGPDFRHYETEICFLVEENHFIAVGVGIDLTKESSNPN